MAACRFGTKSSVRSWFMIIASLTRIQFRLQFKNVYLFATSCMSEQFFLPIGFMNPLIWEDLFPLHNEAFIVVGKIMLSHIRWKINMKKKCSCYMNFQIFWNDTAPAGAMIINDFCDKFVHPHINVYSLSVLNCHIMKDTLNV